ncbi:MAG TPA: MTH938/NDUFAF3 family protein [Gammaproteobacteria bacterium]|nr:hypothetical protein [Xanthomonadales bacterium]MCB1593947.1 hypothetical protein [Xanthomonadales bacterium]HOP21363.1 MTH938/NDUFAF3 family protein [Gammaproteobacteria bacterium]HPI94777.1 MTH938/NDUFAF3 family protein [Gammaproteobacteria bacterium]HPQ86370.1 MTH938/NDUFAF3 family protein [Gammaproteobacteria bacterium]
MKLVENTDNSLNIISSATSDEIVVNGNTIKESCIINSKTVMTDLQLKSIEQLSSTHIEYLLSNQPEIIILGSGLVHQFPHVELLHPLAQNNVGLEVMTNKSAVRTFNVLMAEDRNVACLLIIG